MNLSKQEFLNTGDSAKYIQDKRKLRAELEAEMAKFLANGGEVCRAPTGQSGEVTTNWNGSKKAAQVTMRSIMSVAVAEAHARRNNPNVAARNKAREEGLKHFHGAECVNCRGTLRYTSTNSCFGCNKASALNNYKKRMGKIA